MLLHKVRLLKSLGITNVASIVSDRLLRRRSPAYIRWAKQFEGNGLEIGGPSKVFSRGGYWPVYERARCIDNVNFSDRTEWHGALPSGSCFHFSERKAPGIQFICDAGDLHDVEDQAYDFIVSSHMLEHSANPMRVLNEWKRVLKVRGLLHLVLPHRDGTFDHRRPVTRIEHLWDDFARGTTEADQSHFDEILSLHDLSRDLSQASSDSFRSWILDNVNTRGAHHHVFTSFLAAQLLDAVGFELLAIEPRRPYDIFVTARNPESWNDALNSAILSTGAAYLMRSPFPSDRGAT